MNIKRILIFTVVLFVLQTLLSAAIFTFLGFDQLMSLGSLDYMFATVLPNLVLTTCVLAILALKQTKNIWIHAIAVSSGCLCLNTLIVSFILQELSTSGSFYIELSTAVIALFIGCLIGINARKLKL